MNLCIFGCAVVGRQVINKYFSLDSEGKPRMQPGTCYDYDNDKILFTTPDSNDI